MIERVNRQPSGINVCWVRFQLCGRVHVRSSLQIDEFLVFYKEASLFSPLFWKTEKPCCSVRTRQSMRRWGLRKEDKHGFGSSAETVHVSRISLRNSWVPQATSVEHS